MGARDKNGSGRHGGGGQRGVGHGGLGPPNEAGCRPHAAPGAHAADADGSAMLSTQGKQLVRTPFLT